MQIQIVKSKIHRVKVTGADLNYIGGITIDETLMDAANLIEGEKVYIVNINNGERFETYAIKGAKNSGKGHMRRDCSSYRATGRRLGTHLHDAF